MARYGQAFKDRAVARLLPPESAPVKTMSLERWRQGPVAVPGVSTWASVRLPWPAQAARGADLPE